MKKGVIICGLILSLTIILVACGKKAEAQTGNDLGGQSALTVKTTWAGFTTDRSIWKDSLNQDRKLINDQSLPIYRFDSRADLDDFRSEHSSVYCFDNGFEEVPSFDETAASYDDRFFSEHSILLIYVSSGMDTLRYEVKDIQYDDSTLLVNIQTDYSAGNSDGLAGWFIIIEIGKSDYQDCSSYDALTPYLL